jgi:hypothetical protein
MASIRKNNIGNSTSIIDEAFGDTWSGDKIKGASRDSLYQYLSTINKNLGDVWFFSTNDPEALGEIGNINKPSGELYLSAIVNAYSKPGDTFIFFPGTYTHNNFIQPKKNQTFILINAKYNCNGFLGNIVCSITNTITRSENVTFVGIGSSSINKINQGTEYAFLTPSNYCKIDFKNLTITSPGFMRNMLYNPEHLVRFFGCNLNFTDNILEEPADLYWNSGQVEYHDCNVIGLTAIGNGGSIYGYSFKAYRSYFEAIMNTSGTINSNISLFDITNISSKDIYLEDCIFNAELENITNRTNSSEYLPTKNIIVSRCKFVNGTGWINNQIEDQPFKMTPDSYTTTDYSGFAIINTYPGAGVQVIPNLQI